jgi:hypothetical protein
MLNDDTRLTRCESALFTPIDDAIVMMDIDSGAYYELDGTAARIWHALDRPVTMGELCAGLQERYRVEPDRCRADVSKFVGELVRLSLVQAD